MLMIPQLANAQFLKSLGKAFEDMGKEMGCRTSASNVCSPSNTHKDNITGMSTGRNTYFARIYVYDVDTKKCIAQSKYLTFYNER